jgi:hypothetical protein
VNRRDAAMLAHLDAIEGRLTVLLSAIITRLDRVDERLAGLMVDHATHRHDDD